MELCAGNYLWMLATVVVTDDGLHAPKHPLQHAHNASRKRWSHNFKVTQTIVRLTGKQYLSSKRDNYKNNIHTIIYVIMCK